MLQAGLVSAKTANNLYYRLSQVNWVTTLFLIFTPIVSIYGIYTTPFIWQTWVFSVFCFIVGMLSMTVVYHRMYSHRSFKCCRPVEIFFLFVACADWSMSALDWVADHRLHHRYTDTDKDPYNIKKGFWWAHVGWLINERDISHAEIPDLAKDPVIAFQHKRFFSLAVLIGWVMPTVICGILWNDWRGGFFIAAIFKTVVQHHCIFSINSVAHYIGDTPFNEDITPRENFLCAVITMGEGYHNFHHEFPNDYRNGVDYTAWDPTKWLIAFLEYLGLAHELKRTTKEQIKLSRIQMLQRKLERERKGIFTGRPINELPFYTKEQVTDLCTKKGQQLVIEGELVYDVSNFVQSHPGGSKIVTLNIGRDITKSFNGGVYGHSNAAKNLLQTLRCGRLRKDNTTTATAAAQSE